MDLNKFKMDLFDNGEPEESLLFIQNFKMTVHSPGMLAFSAMLQYLRRLLRGEALCQFDTLCDRVGITNTMHLIQIILGLGT